MSSTTFIDGQTIIKSSWLNDVNTEVYTNTHVNSITAGTDITVTSSTGNPVIALASTIHSNTTGNAATANTANTANTATTAGTATALSVLNPVTLGGTGLATLPANSVMLGNGTSTPTFVAPSTSGKVLMSDGTTWQSTVLPTAKGLGLDGETWHNVMSTPGRASGTTYTAPAYPIMVTVGGQAVSGVPTITVVVGGVTINTWSFPYGTGQPITFIVPASATYVVTFSAGCTMNYWNELY